MPLPAKLSVTFLCLAVIVFIPALHADPNFRPEVVTQPGVIRPQTQEVISPKVKPVVPATVTPPLRPPEFITPAAKSAAAPANPVNPADIMKQLDQLGSQLSAGNPPGGGVTDANGKTSTSPELNSDSPTFGGGQLIACPSPLPESVQKALDETKAFRASCRLANAGAQQNIAINDYSVAQNPSMYLFDANYKCMNRTEVSYGNGAGDTRPMPCSSDGDHMTPAGFHLTLPNDGAVYNHTNSLLLVGLEGQGSAGRGIRIHGSDSPGTPCSWGCSGVSHFTLNYILSALKKGGLVYNYFGDTSSPSNCHNTAGSGHTHNGAACRLDSGGAAAGTNPGGVPTAN